MMEKVLQMGNAGLLNLEEDLESVGVVVYLWEEDPGGLLENLG